MASDRLVEFRIHGVDGDFIREVQKSGMKDMTPQELVEFSIHGGRRWLRRAAASGRQIPSSKLQNPNQNQLAKSTPNVAPVPGLLGFGTWAWLGFGIWSLGFD